MIDHFRQAFLRETRHVIDILTGDFQRFVLRRRMRAAEDVARRAGARSVPVEPACPSDWSSDPRDWLADAFSMLRATLAEDGHAAGRRVEVEIDADPVALEPAVVEAIAAALRAIGRSRITTCAVPQQRGSGRSLVRIRLIAHREPGRVVVAFEDDGGAFDRALVGDVRSAMAAVGGSIAASGAGPGGARIALSVPVADTQPAAAGSIPSVELAGARR